MVLGIEPRPCTGYANAVSLSFIPQLTGVGMDEEVSIDLGQSGLHRELKASLRDTWDFVSNEKSDSLFACLRKVSLE